MWRGQDPIPPLEASLFSFAAEAGHFANQGFNTAICGPGDIAQAHRGDEFISKDQLNKGVGMIQNLIKEFSWTNNK